MNVPAGAGRVRSRSGPRRKIWPGTFRAGPPRSSTLNSTGVPLRVPTARRPTVAKKCIQRPQKAFAQVLRPPSLSLVKHWEPAPQVVRSKDRAAQTLKMADFRPLKKVKIPCQSAAPPLPIPMTWGKSTRAAISTKTSVQADACGAWCVCVAVGVRGVR